MHEEENMERMREYQEVLRKILSAFEGVSFPVIVESSTGYKVISIDKDRDKDLIEDLSTIAGTVTKHYYETPVTRNTYREVVNKEPKAFRENEVGRILEYVFCDTAKNYNKINKKYKLKAISEVQHLKQGGYPDIRIKEKTERVAFLDIKATTRPNEGSPRDFFYSTKEKTLGKINSDGFHLLLGFIIKERKPEEFITIGWKLVDLSKIKVSLKAEFNTNNLEIYKADAIIIQDFLET